MGVSVVTLRGLQRRMAEQAPRDGNMLRVLDGNRGGCAIPEQMRVDRVAEPGGGALAQPLVEHRLTHGRAGLRDPQALARLVEGMGAVAVSRAAQQPWPIV